MLYLSKTSNQQHTKTRQLNSVQEDLAPLLSLELNTPLGDTFKIKSLTGALGDKVLLEKKVSRCLLAGCTYLQKGLLTSSTTTTCLRPYYEQARELIRGAKISLLKCKLAEEQLDVERYNLALKKLHELAARVYICYEKLDFDLPPAYSRHTPPLFTIPSVTSSSSALSSLELEANFAPLKYTIELQRAERIFYYLWKQRGYLRLFTQLTPAICQEHWEQKLKDALLQVEGPAELCAIAKILAPIQVLKILSTGLEDEALKFIMPYILVASSIEVLEEILVCLSQERTSLLKLNQILREAAAEKDEIRKWIEEQFYTIRQSFVDRRNQINSSIDMLCRRFRDHMYAYTITKDDLKDIDDLHFNLKLRKVNVETLQILFQGLVKDLETIKVFNELVQTYQTDIARLDPQDHKQAYGNVWGIISRNTFGAAGYDSEDEAFECFALWHLTTAHSLLNCGLVTSEECAQTLTQYKKTHPNEAPFNPKEETLQALNAIALQRLNQAGLYKIGDFERHCIYNVNLLREFNQSQSID